MIMYNALNYNMEGVVGGGRGVYKEIPWKGEYKQIFSCFIFHNI